MLALVKVLGRERYPKEIIPTYSHDADITLTEGYKKGRWPKIEVSQGYRPRDLLFREEDGLLAVVAKGKFPFEVPCFSWAEIPQVADLIAAQWMGIRKPAGGS